MAAMSVHLHVVDHPLVVDALTRIRDKATPNALFRQELERIGLLLLVEATRHLTTEQVSVETPITTTTGRALSSQPVIVPILRAGLGFVPPAQELLPNADVGFIEQRPNAPPSEKLVLVARSLIQVFYFLPHGVEVPGEHFASGVAKATLEADGRMFDWHQVTGELFTVKSCRGKNPPASAGSR